MARRRMMHTRQSLPGNACTIAPTTFSAGGPAWILIPMFHAGSFLALQVFSLNRCTAWNHD